MTHTTQTDTDTQLLAAAVLAGYTAGRCEAAMRELDAMQARIARLLGRETPRTELEGVRAEARR